MNGSPDRRRRNRDQEQIPQREGDRFPDTMPPKPPERGRDAPIPEEETYERERRDQRGDPSQ